MTNEQNCEDDRAVTATVSADSLVLIDHYADARGLYRSNWLREAISEKLARELEAETGITLSKREAA